MPSLWQEPTRRGAHDRIDRIDPAAAPRWGRMNAAQMMVHCAAQLRIALGELEAAPIHTPVRYPPLKQLFVYLLPVPRGMPTVPELRDPVRAGWKEDRAALHDRIERFAAEDRARRWPPHPAFGTLSGRGWGSLAYKHLDHHLRQFGV